MDVNHFVVAFRVEGLDVESREYSLVIGRRTAHYFAVRKFQFNLVADEVSSVDILEPVFFDMILVPGECFDKEKCFQVNNIYRRSFI